MPLAGAFPPDASEGGVSAAPRSQWRDRAGFSPASLAPSRQLSCAFEADGDTTCLQLWDSPAFIEKRAPHAILRTEFHRRGTRALGTVGFAGADSRGWHSSRSA